MHPVLFKIGPITIQSYGVLVATAFFVGFFLLYREAKRKNFYADKILDLELLILVSGIIGARALHVLVNLDFYSKNLFDIFLVWKGGLALYGGLILAMLVFLGFVLKKNMPPLETADFIAPYIALGQSIGRIGCFLNGCCFGKLATAPFLGIIFPGDTRSRYATQIYASLALLCAFIILRLVQRKPPFNGFVFGFYLLLYSFQRFLIDFLRGDTPRYALNLTVSQIISIIVFTAVTFLLFLLHKANEPVSSSK